MNPKRRIALILGLMFMVVLTGVCIAASLSLGSKSLPLLAIWQHYWLEDSGSYYDLVINTREPRTLIGLMAGAALALAGAVTQGLLRNPLGDPGLLGVNAGAAATVVCFSFIPVLDGMPRFWTAFIGASLSTLLFYLLSGGSRNTNPTRLVLTGAAINTCLFALVQGVILLNPQVMDSYRFWTIGSLSTMSLSEASSLIPYLLVAVILTLSLSISLNVMFFGEGIAGSLGANVARTRVLSLLSATMLAACATAMAGPIAFVGLAAPHLMRALVGSDFRWLLPYCLFAGACLLLISDIVARLLIAPEEIMVGIITASIGAPLLYWVAKSRSQRIMAE
ncbi:FecCD family ABC transporter permease [Xenorhabdus hominickii]|uniref:Cobalamin/Fe3+-siderophores transport system, permease component n=1 Tax=Xenorhabdus hominickii TaxID=351679 RepID=A0A2G0QA90_XENHO|nr:iron chelate uptake ABC transporter family permease subunit [Xenorhabdus hominickii]AOM40900.1 iron ABC transporter permease [Xenorhabdus hominickii]PHM56130.1 cobalamin/Fe3+-siderophores transport system, permease component [Xenorhabdus hominickii]